jgi:hypothetical protein
MPKKFNVVLYSTSFNWILILASFIPGSGILIIQSFNNSESSSLLVLFFQSAIALAFGIVFFVPLWRRLNLKHEGEFILERYSGKAAIVLHRFRSGYLYFIVIPLLIALQLSSIKVVNGFPFFSQYLPFIIGISIAVIGVAGYGFKRMIYFETIVAIATLVMVGLYAVYHPTDLSSKSFDFAGSLSWSMIIPPLFFFWWFAGIVDMPDMRAQKLLSLRGQRFGSWLVALPFLLVCCIQGVFLAFPMTGNGTNYNLVYLVLFFNILVVVLSLMHWSAHLFEQCFSRSNIARIAMVFCVFMAMVWVYFGQSTQAIFSQFVLMTAGVGPVYLLRWFWPRINALTQLSAMIGAFAIPILYRLTGIDSTTYEMIVHTGIINCVLWLSVMILTSNKNEITAAQEFIQRINARNEILSWKSWLKFLFLSAVFLLAILFLSVYDYLNS